MARRAAPKGKNDTQITLDAIRTVVKVLREGSRQAERQVGLSGAQLFVLQKLAAEPGMSVNDLAARTLTHQSSVSVVVKRLEEAGLVARGAADDDGRRVVLTLTAKGERTVRGMPDLPQARLIRALEALPVAERKALARSLSRVASALGETGRPPMFFE